MSKPEWVVLDTETTGLNPWKGDRPFIVGFGFPDGNINLHRLNMTVNTEVNKALADPDITKIGHNIKFDVHMLREAGYTVNGHLIDTMLLVQLDNPNLDSYKLKDLARTILHADTNTESALLMYLKTEARKQGRALTFADVPAGMLEPYLTDDIRYTRRLYQMYWPLVSNHPNLHTELRLIPIILRMEQRGIKIDPNILRQAIMASSGTLQTLDAKLKSISGNPDLNYQSPKQISVACNSLGLRPLKQTKKKNPSYSADTLPLYKHEFTDALLQARELNKLCSTYYKPLLDLSVNDTIHPSFRQNGAITGRFSCAEPNLQNIPRRDSSVRRAFIARPNHWFLFADYSQIEIRLFAHYSCSKVLQQYIIDGEDLHANTAKILWPHLWSDETKQKGLRQAAKTFNFELIYGGGPRKTVETLRKLARQELKISEFDNLTIEQAIKIHENYYVAYPDVRSFMEQTIEQLNTYGCVIDAYGKAYNCPKNQAYKAVNYLIQGTASQVIKRGMVKVFDYVEESGGHIINTIHDELIIELSGPMNMVHISNIVQLMEDRHRFSVPITVDMAWSDASWADKRSVNCPQNAAQ